MNAFGDDYVSFTALHVSFSPDERYLLVSTGITKMDGQRERWLKR